MAYENYSLSERARARLTHWIAPPFNLTKQRIWWYMIDNPFEVDRNAIQSILTMWCIIEAMHDEDHALVKELEEKEGEAIEQRYQVQVEALAK